ncbi:MAG: hypothetical protein O3B43_04935 [Chloroflexi bacterium]|nr:hypothetical protein [Chloroflexota bacterium]
MERNNRVVLGVLLIGAGVLLTLQQLNLIPGGWEDVIVGLAYLAGFVFFLTTFLSNRSQWWAALSTFIFLGLTLSRGIELFAPGLEDLGGAIFFLLMGLGFLTVFSLERSQWWAIIPGGVMLSLAALVAVEELGANIGFEPAGLLFIGMGVTFLALSAMKVEGQRLSWAIFPAIPLLLLGLFVGLENEAVWAYVWPSLIILLGLYFVAGAARRK